MSTFYHDDLDWHMMNPDISILQDYIRSMDGFLVRESEEYNAEIDRTYDKIQSGEIKPILDDSVQIPLQMEYEFYRVTVHAPAARGLIAPI